MERQPPCFVCADHTLAEPVSLADASGLHRTEIFLVERGDRERRLTKVVRLA